MNAAQGRFVVFQAGGESRIRAECDNAQQAADILNKARYLNDAKRRYTAAARLIASVESLPGFRWIE